MSGRQQRTMVSPINIIFKYLQSAQPVCIWLYDIVDFKLEGKIVGFDEFMNVVLDDAYEVWTKTPRGEQTTAPSSDKVKREYGSRTSLGRLLLKGENITLIQPAQKHASGPARGGLTSTQAMES